MYGVSPDNAATSPVPLQCEQMEVELHDVEQSARPSLKGRLANYRKELTRLRKEFVSPSPVYYCILSEVHSPELMRIHVYV